MREQTLKAIQKFYIQERLDQVDLDCLRFEEVMASESDLEKIALDIEQKLCGWHEWEQYDNVHNSIILYITGIADNFDFKKGRCDHTGGTPPDIDLDFQPSRKDDVFQYIIETYGEESVSHIGAIGTFGLKSIAQALGRINEPIELKKKDFENEADYDEALQNYNFKLKEVRAIYDEVSNLVPEPVHGKAADLDKMVNDNLNAKKPIDIKKQYPEFYNFASYAEDMRKQLGVHAAGVLLFDGKIADQFPLYRYVDKETKEIKISTQFDKDEIERLGGLKFDLLLIDALDVIAETLKRIDKPIDLEKDLYENPTDSKVYDLITSGKLVGIFQFEAEGLVKKLAMDGAPTTLHDLSVLTSLNRPGPLTNKLDVLYLSKPDKPDDMPDKLAKLLKPTRYCMVYQEQIMQAVSDLAGFNLKEADDVRRALGKKKVEILTPLEERFVQGCLNLKSCGEVYARQLWEDLGRYADYVFNSSHSYSYSLVTYVTAWLKTYYPLQFYSSLLTIKSLVKKGKQDEFQAKLKEVINEARELGIEIKAPDINFSSNGFTENELDKSVYFGFSGIKSLAQSSINEIIKARPSNGFKDIWDFLDRVNKSKVNTGKLTALVKSGCFDKMGYDRGELFNFIQPAYDYYNDLVAYEQRIIDSKQRDLQREDAIKNSSKKMPALKLMEMPIKPSIERHSKISITYTQLQEQAAYTGVFLGLHPTEMVKGNFKNISDVWIGDYPLVRGLVTSCKEVTTKKGDKMAFIKIEDASASCDLTIFSSVWVKIRDQISVNKMIKTKVKVESEKPIKCIAQTIEVIN